MVVLQGHTQVEVPSAPPPALLPRATVYVLPTVVLSMKYRGEEKWRQLERRRGITWLFMRAGWDLFISPLPPVIRVSPLPLR